MVYLVAHCHGNKESKGLYVLPLINLNQTDQTSFLRHPVFVCFGCRSHVNTDECDFKLDNIRNLLH